MESPHESLALEMLPVLVSFVDQDQIYRYVNRQYEIWFGLSRNQVIGKRLVEVLGTQAYAAIADKVKSALSGKPVSFESELQYKRAGTRWVEINFLPDVGSGGEVRGYVAMIRDISLKRRLEKEARAAKDLLYKTLLESIPDIVIWATNDEGEVEFVNQNWVLTTGRDLHLSRHGGWLEVMHRDDRDRVAALWAKAIHGGSSYTARARFKTWNGYRTFDIHGQPVRDSRGRILWWVGTCIDVESSHQEKAKLYEETQVAQQANRAKSAFLAHMSHEIRTPLTAVIGYSEILSRRPLPDQDKQVVRAIQRNAEHLHSLVCDVLDLSKIDAGSDIEVMKQELDPRAAIRTVIDMFAIQAQRKGVRLSARIDERLPSRIESDERILRQVLTNLVGNAVKFTRHGSIDLDVQFDAEHDLLRLVVTDTGPGIPIEDQGRIFQPFAQTRQGARLMGTGLGLTLCRTFARRLGGEVVLRWSEPEKGSAFEATFRVGVPADASATTLPLRPETGEDTLRGRRVLLIEDSDDIRELMVTVLTQNGADVVAVSNGLDGVKRARGENFGVILADIQLPDIDGHETLRRLRAAGVRSPVIALTADATREELERCRHSGFDDYRTKPIPIDELVGLVAARGNSSARCAS